jgi:hypothetical protein
MRFGLVVLMTPLMIAGSAQAQRLSARTDSVMKAAEKEGFGGVVRIEKDGAVVLEKGYGLAIRKPETKFTPATVVQIGSNTKDFTAVAILQLQERGKLNIGDPLGKFFPSAPADKRGITLRQLLNHRAGFPLGLGGDFDPVSRQQLIDNAMKVKLLFTPGEKQSYSNTGFSILAAIIEKLSGKSYDVYVRDNILTPLRLTHTGFLLPKFKASELAHGYERGGKDAGNIINKPHAADGPYWNLRGNGGMVSTVGDMHTFYKALFETDKLLKPSTREIMFKSNEPVGLAGSDLVNFFLYERDPIAKTEIILASNDADHRAPMVRTPLAVVLGLPTGVGGGGGPVAKPNGKPPAPQVAAVINAFIAALNSADNKALLAFITDHFANGASDPKPDERMGRIGGVHQNLGDITVDGMYDSGEGPIQVVIKTKNEGAGTLMVNIDRGAPYRIKSMGLQIGGD